MRECVNFVSNRFLSAWQNLKKAPTHPHNKKFLFHRHKKWGKSSDRIIGDKRD